MDIDHQVKVNGTIWAGEINNFLQAKTNTLITKTDFCLCMWELVFSVSLADRWMTRRAHLQKLWERNNVKMQTRNTKWSRMPRGAVWSNTPSTLQIDTVNTAVPLHDKIIQVQSPVHERPPPKCNHTSPRTYLRRQNLMKNIFNTPREIAQTGHYLICRQFWEFHMIMNITDNITRFQHVGVKCCSWSGLFFHWFFWLVGAAFTPRQGLAWMFITANLTCLDRWSLFRRQTADKTRSGNT